MGHRGQSYPQRHTFTALLSSNMTLTRGQARGHCSVSSDRWGDGKCCPYSHRASGWERGQEPSSWCATLWVCGGRHHHSPTSGRELSQTRSSSSPVTNASMSYMLHFPWNLDSTSFLPFRPRPGLTCLAVTDASFLNDFPTSACMSNLSSVLDTWISEQDKPPA